MIYYRHRGFVGIHRFICLIVAMLLLPAFAATLPWIPLLKLERNVDLFPYVLMIGTCLMLANRNSPTFEAELHRISWLDAFRISSRRVVVVAIGIAGLSFAFKDRNISRMFLGTYLVLLWFILAFLYARFPRLLAAWLFSAKEKTLTLLIGKEENASVLNSWLARRRHLGVVPAGILLDKCEIKKVGLDAPILGTWDELPSVIKDYEISQVILLGWLDDALAVERMIQQSEAAGCRFLIHNDYGSRFARRFYPLEEGGFDFLAVQPEPLEDPVNRMIKRAFDLMVAIPVVATVLPMSCLVVMAIHLFNSPGPLFFSFPRNGLRQGAFNMLKFRSMHTNVQNVGEQATRADPRIFKGGHWLRRTSVDELPQFWNVLFGHMSVVGPRPHLSQHDDAFSRIAPSYRIRSLVKPGITGLAQVKGFRGEVDSDAKLHSRLYWDLFYARSWSPALDVKIVMSTAWQVIRPPKSAY